VSATKRHPQANVNAKEFGSGIIAFEPAISVNRSLVISSVKWLLYSIQG
jgi:hypothetical protein